MPTIRDYGLVPGHLPAGPRNAITDVPGVRVGHTTVNTGAHRTGVTVILPGKMCTPTAAPLPPM